MPFVDFDGRQFESIPDNSLRQTEAVDKDYRFPIFDS